jgi:hypothetical protein
VTDIVKINVIQVDQSIFNGELNLIVEFRAAELGAIGDERAPHWRGLSH